MQELEKILEEIEHLEKIQFSSYTKPLITIEDVEKIIRKHMNDKSETYAFDFANTEAFDCPCGRHYVHLAIPPKLEFCEKCKEKVRKYIELIYVLNVEKNYMNMRKNIIVL